MSRNLLGRNQYTIALEKKKKEPYFELLTLYGKYQDIAAVHGNFHGNVQYALLEGYDGTLLRRFDVKIFFPDKKSLMEAFRNMKHARKMQEKEENEKRKIRIPKRFLLKEEEKISQEEEKEKE